MKDQNQDITAPLSNEELNRILNEVNVQSIKLVNAFLDKQKKAQKIDQTESNVILKSFQNLSTQLLKDPRKLFDTQLNFWQDYWSLVQKSSQQFLGRTSEPVIAQSASDKRFKNEEWDTNPLFSFIKQSYLLTTRAIHNMLEDVEGLDEKTRRYVDFYTSQFTNAISPTNFIATNPELLKVTIESRGANLVRGLKNLLDDLERGPCNIQIKLTDLDAFEVGKNLAVTPGKVVYQNDLMQLIQYAPATQSVHSRPLLIIPPWINKYYILDLTPQNSMIKWFVDHGYTLFVVSWVNPDDQHREKKFEDYMLEGPVAALDKIEKIVGKYQVNVIGYCMGGTLLGCAAAYLKARKKNRIASLTFMASLLDFSRPGDIGVFVDEDQVKALEEQMETQGYLDGCSLANSFNMIRANDLIWSSVINNYLKGASPVPFDILFWNADATNLPAKMHSFYLRNMYLRNRLREPGGITLAGVPIDLSSISVPTYFISTKEDHISLWESTYKGAKLLSGPVRYVLGASGHVAGIVNPPAKNKYGHWTNDALPDTPSEWFKQAQFNSGSWWLDWLEWNKAYAGNTVTAREIKEDEDAPLEDAPGCYVTNRLDRPESGVCYMTNFA